MYDHLFTGGCAQQVQLNKSRIVINQYKIVLIIENKEVCTHLGLWTHEITRALSCCFSGKYCIFDNVKSFPVSVKSEYDVSSSMFAFLDAQM